MKELKLTPTKVRLEFQEFSINAQRPSDGRLNEREMILGSISDIPIIGDYISFLNEEDGAKGHYKVKSRNFTYKWHEDEWFIYANVVLDEISENEFSMTIKE